MKATPIPATVNPSFATRVSAAVIAERLRKQERSYHFDNAVEDFNDFSSLKVEEMLDQLCTDIPELPKVQRTPRLSQARAGVRKTTLSDLLGKGGKMSSSEKAAADIYTKKLAAATRPQVPADEYIYAG